MMRAFVVTGVVLIAAGLNACSGPRTETPVVSAAGLPVADYRAAAGRGETVYRIGAAGSLVTVYVYRDGPLAGLGHDHVIASRDVSGYAHWPDDPDAARADLVLPIESVVVDEADLRLAAGFETEPSDDDIAGTRANMFTSIDAAAFPDIGLRVTLSRPPPEPRLKVDIRWHGATESFDVPVALTLTEARLDVSGSFELSQTDFGISPHSVFGGALSVADRLHVSFRLLGERVTRFPPDDG